MRLRSTTLYRTAHKHHGVRTHLRSVLGQQGSIWSQLRLLSDLVSSCAVPFLTLSLSLWPPSGSLNQPDWFPHWPLLSPFACHHSPCWTLKTSLRGRVSQSSSLSLAFSILHHYLHCILSTRDSLWLTPLRLNDPIIRCHLRPSENTDIYIMIYNSSKIIIVK